MMKYLKIYEEFNQFHLDEISESEFRSLRTEECPIEYRKSFELHQRMPDGFDSTFGYSYFTIVGEDKENPTL